MSIISREFAYGIEVHEVYSYPIFPRLLQSETHGQLAFLPESIGLWSVNLWGIAVLTSSYCCYIRLCNTIAGAKGFVYLRQLHSG